MPRILTLAAVVTLLGAGAASAQATNFTGTWKLNPSLSNFGQMPAPSSLTQTITQDESSVKAAVQQTSDFGDMSFDFTFTTDGKESLNEANGVSVKSVAQFEGPVLHIESSMDFGGGPMTMNDRWSLSPDGKQFTIDRKVTSAMGDGDAKMVFDKQ